MRQIKISDREELLRGGTWVSIVDRSYVELVGEWISSVGKDEM